LGLVKPKSRKKKAEKGKNRKAASEPTLASTPGIYIVEAILASRSVRGKLPEYLVHWEGYPHTENTWEPAENLENNILLEAFLLKEKLDAQKTSPKTLPPTVLSAKAKVAPKPANVWGPRSAQHGVAKRKDEAGDTGSGPPSAKRHKASSGGGGVDISSESRSSGGGSSAKTKGSSSKSPLKSQDIRSVFAGSGSGGSSSSSAKSKLVVWADIDSGAAMADETQNVPCPFPTCTSTHSGLHELERHLRTTHASEKTCLCW
jgi:hypothetical protein